MGPDETGEKDRPTRNKWVEGQIAEGAFGAEDAGIESISSGGLHTLFIDEKGTVRDNPLTVSFYSSR
jgi:Alpha-tubulin suppressor and related RCC1 domain-containing proteins